MTITPTLEEFKEFASKGNLIPVYAELVADMETPVSAYHKLRATLPPGTRSFLLESVEGGENLARHSFLGAGAGSVFQQHAGRAEWIRGDETAVIEGRDVFAKIHDVLATYRPVEMEGLPPFTGGAVGYAAYDVVSEIEPTVVQPDEIPLDTPEAFFMFMDTVMVFDRVEHTIKIVSHAFLADDAIPEDAYAKAVAAINAVAEALRAPLSMPPMDAAFNGKELTITSNKTREEFHEMVRRAKRHIRDGDIIQAVLSQRFQAETTRSPLSVYRALRRVNPSPYMFLLDCGDFAVVGASPEVHAKCENRKVTVRPIAGTRWRGTTPEEDLALERELLADPKERAEHIMLVDLARNDIGRIATVGSVKPDELMVVERYSHVMHIVSNVSGELADGLEADAVMRSTFPAGTLSGAPKVRAMQIISDLESERRGPYGGVVAYYSFNGNVDSCITIRTAVLKDGNAYVQAGGGIVADSVPENEYQESRNKAKAMMKALAAADMFET